MPWGRSYKKVSSYRAPSNPSVWQQSGATQNAKSACAQYGVTWEDLVEAKIPCQWRSTYGNSYAVVVNADVEALAQRLRNEKKVRARAALVKQHGEEGAAKIEAAEEAKKEKKATAAAREAALAAARSALQRAMVRAATDEASVEGARLPKRKLKLRLNKAEAKATFGYNEAEMAALPGGAAVRLELGSS